MSPLALSLRFLQTQPDSRLVELARAGHTPAFEALVRRYRKALLSYCRKLASPDSTAEDILQQGLLQAWSALNSGIEVRDARAWLYRIVHNVAVSTYRRSPDPAVELEEAATARGTDDAVQERLAVREALASLAALPGLQRDVMVSTALDGRTHEEIATALGLSSGAVRGLIYRARATMRAAAAALIPGPVAEWAARHAAGGAQRVGAISELVAGGGSAGVAGVLLKGGAIVATAGALATAAGITTMPPPHRPRAPRPAAAQSALAKRERPVQLLAVRAVSRPAREHAAAAAGSRAKPHAVNAVPRATGLRHSVPTRPPVPSALQTGSHEGSPTRHSPEPTGSDGSPSAGERSGSGSDGGSGSTSSGTSDGGGSRDGATATTASSGSDGGSGGGSSSSGSSDGASTSSDGASSSSDGASATATTTSASSDQSTSTSDGGSSDSHGGESPSGDGG